MANFKKSKTKLIETKKKSSNNDVSGTDSPYRETGNIYDGSRFIADTG